MYGEKPAVYQRKNRYAPAAACKRAKTKFTVFVGIFPKSFAPKNPPAVTPSAVGMSKEKS